MVYGGIHRTRQDPAGRCGVLTLGSIEVYDIEGRIYEKHGKYDCYLEVWSDEGSTKSRVWNAYEELGAPEGSEMTEHEEILWAIRAVCTRIAETRDVPLF